VLLRGQARLPSGSSRQDNNPLLPLPHRDPWRAGGADRRCLERRVRADELDAFVFDQIRQLLARPDLLAAGETALAEQTPAADDELLAAQLDRLERRLQTTRSERGRIADLYQAG